ncbi:MAG: exodeoxyribonuclease VII large subunit [Acholeplasmatales bacterium]|nr:exodeoxyribonuclease VII large subunit [Acholeplasmatales bacterium]
MEEERYLTVTALNRYIKYKFQYDTNLKGILIEGELSNFKRHSRGHFYFTLKDESSQISCIMFASSASKVNFNPKDGDKVYLRGDVQTYEQGGTYQIYATNMKLSGIGDLYLQFEKLKKELASAGLFDERYKKPLPKYPNTIGVITSPTGAAIHDIITTTARRYPLARIVLYPALVQGENAKESVASQIRHANEDGLCDVLIVGRGGGSLEDLWAFNEKIVAMAIFDSKIPVISAVGHEVDFSISDFVADKRAATPTAGAELATPNVVEIRENISEYIHQLTKNIKNKINDKESNLVHILNRLDAQNPLNKLNQTKDKLDSLVERLNIALNNSIINNTNQLNNYNKSLNLLLNRHLQAASSRLDKANNLLNPYIKRILDNKENEFKLNVEKLKALNPLSIMDKGYSVAMKENKVIKSVKDVKINDTFNLSLKDGTLSACVMEVKENGK